MKTNHQQADFRPGRYSFDYQPVLHLHPDEKEQLQQKLWTKIQTIPDALHNLLGPSASFCRLDQIIYELEEPSVPNKISTGFTNLILDYHRYGFWLPSQKSLSNKLQHPVYRQYALKRITDQLLNAVQSAYLARYLPKIQVNQQLVDVQLKSHPYLSSQLNVDLPIKDEWYQIHAQKNWEQIKQMLDDGKPAPLSFVGAKTDLFSQRHMIVSQYKIVDKYSLTVTGTTLPYQTTNYQLTFHNGFTVERNNGGKSCALPRVKTIHAPEYTPVQPSATTWWERWLYPIIAKWQMRKKHHNPNK